MPKLWKKLSRRLKQQNNSSAIYIHTYKVFGCRKFIQNLSQDHSREYWSPSWSLWLPIHVKGGTKMNFGHVQASSNSAQNNFQWKVVKNDTISSWSRFLNVQNHSSALYKVISGHHCPQLTTHFATQYGSRHKHNTVDPVINIIQ